MSIAYITLHTQHSSWSNINFVSRHCTLRACLGALCDLLMLVELRTFRPYDVSLWPGRDNGEDESYSRYNRVRLLRLAVVRNSLVGKTSRPEAKRFWRRNVKGSKRHDSLSVNRCHFQFQTTHRITDGICKLLVNFLRFLDLLVFDLI